MIEAQRRTALLEAMLGELSANGYAGLSTSRALRSAGVDLAEFEAEFADVDECLVAAYEELSARLLRRATGGCDSSDPWPDRVREGLAAVLEAIACSPDMAQVMTRGFPGVRPAFYGRYVDLLGSFLPFMREGREFSGIEEELPDEVELLAVGAAESIIFGELEAGRAEALPGLLPEILFSVLVPFIGPERAADEMRSAAAAG